MNRTLQQHIQENQKELDSYLINGQRKRHLESELESLESYQKNHPDQEKDPTALELYCDSHPDALECRIYD